MLAHQESISPSNLHFDANFVPQTSRPSFSISRDVILHESCTASFDLALELDNPRTIAALIIPTDIKCSSPNRTLVLRRK